MLLLIINKNIYIYLYYSLTKVCKLAVGNFTEVQAERIELNPIISSACQHVMEHHCEVYTIFFFLSLYGI